MINTSLRHFCASYRRGWDIHYRYLTPDTTSILNLNRFSTYRSRVTFPVAFLPRLKLKIVLLNSAAPPPSLLFF